MGTTLTGTTPQDTYDSLIKVTNNGPLSSTARYLSDGLGNDSVLALSTSAVGVGTTSNSYTAAGRGNLNIAGSAGAILGFQIGGAAKGYVFHDSTNLQLWNEVAGDLLFGANATERMRITATGNVGIGTTPSAWGSTFRALQIGAGSTIYNNDAANGTFVGSNYFYNGSNNVYKNDGTATAYGQISGKHSFFTAPSGSAGGTVSFVERVTVTSDGLTFNGDTAAANALDDYEEGTWTMGVAFGGGSTGVTYANNTGTYTKIGRQVTVNGFIQLTSKGSSTGDATITGLPFVIANSSSNFSAATLVFSAITFTNQFQGFGTLNTTNIKLEEITVLGAVTSISNADFADNSYIVLSFTYFV